MAFCKIVGGEGSGNNKAIDEAFGRYWVWFSAKFLHPSGMNRKHINNFASFFQKYIQSWIFKKSVQPLTQPLDIGCMK